MPKVRLIKHEAVKDCGSFEIRFPDGRPSRFVYWDDLAGRRLLPDRVDRAVAERVAKIFARAEQHALNLGILEPLRIGIFFMGTRLRWL